MRRFQKEHGRDRLCATYWAAPHTRSPYRSPGTPIASLNNKLEAASADNMLSFVLRLDNVEWSRGAFMIIDRRTTNPIARLRPIPDTDRFELFYWSNAKGRWTTFGNLCLSFHSYVVTIPGT